MVAENDMAATSEPDGKKLWQTPLVIEATLRDETEKPTFVVEFTSFGTYGPS